MGFFKFKFGMNFLMNLSTQLQIISALLIGGWGVYQGRLEIGGVVAFISGVGKITDPWGDLVNYFRDANLSQVRYALVRDALNQQGFDALPDECSRPPQPSILSSNDREGGEDVRTVDRYRV